MGPCPSHCCSPQRSHVRGLPSVLIASGLAADPQPGGPHLNGVAWIPIILSTMCFCARLRCISRSDAG